MVPSLVQPCSRKSRSRHWTLLLFLGVSTLGALAADSVPREKQESLADQVWRRIEWSGGVLVWRYPQSDHLFGGSETRIYWKPGDEDALFSFTGSLGLALVELERSEEVDLNELLRRSSYVTRQYHSVVAELDRRPRLAGTWQRVAITPALRPERRASGGSLTNRICIFETIDASATGNAEDQGQAGRDPRAVRYAQGFSLCNNPCLLSDSPCCDDPCCSDPACCGDLECCSSVCCGDDCCGDPCCGGPCEPCDDPCDPICGGPCSGSCDDEQAKCQAGCLGANPACCDDPCCGRACCGEPCCDNPCGPDCDDEQAKCLAGCEGANPKCCDDPCCGDKCCEFPTECCDEPDPCCESDDPCACSKDPCSPFCEPDPCDPRCGGNPCSPDCGDPCAPECEPDPCSSPCGDPCAPECRNCDDGNPCTEDGCASGSCINAPIDCDDANECTTDACDSAEGGCVHEPVVCDDGNACNGVEQCDPAIGCQITPDHQFSGPNLRIDSNNDGQISDSDDNIEDLNPGRILVVNDDDDNSNGIPDRDDPEQFADDELARLTLLGGAEPGSPSVSSWTLTYPGSVRVYLSNDRTNPVVSGRVNPWPVPTEAFVEALDASGAEGDIIIQLAVSADGGKPCTDQVVATALEMYVGMSGDIDADTQESFITVLFSPFFEPDLTGPLEGWLLELTLRLNSVNHSAHLFSIEAGSVTYGFDTSTNPGDTYDAVVSFLGTTRESDSFKIVPGDPATIEAQLSQASYASDHNALMQVIATIRDQFGNLLVDGTSVSWLLDNSTSSFMDGPDGQITSTTEGWAAATLIAPALPVAQDLVVSSTPIEQLLQIPVIGTTGTLSGPSSLDVALGQTGVVTLNTNASNGTPVYWTISNGNVIDASTVVSGGTSSITVSAQQPPLFRSRVGTCYVTATVGEKLAYHAIDFYSSNFFYIELERPVISGDVTSDGIDTYLLPDVLEIPGAPAVVPDTIVNVPYYATTDVTIRGGAFELYEVGLFDPLHSSYVEFFGLGANNRVTLNASGEFTFEIRSKGNLGLPPGPDYFLHVPFYVSLFGPCQRVCNGPTAQIDTLTLAKHNIYTRALDAATSFIGGDPETAAGFATNVAGGMMIVGDLGSLVKNYWRAMGFIEGEASVLEVSLSSLGLLTELAVGVGRLADAPISGVRAIVAAVGNTPLSQVLVILVKRAITNIQDLANFGQFIAKLITDASYVQVANAIFTSEDLVKAGIKCTAQLGDDFLPVLKSVATDAAFGGTKAAKSVTQVLDSLPGDILLSLKNSGKLTEAVQGMAKAMFFGKIDPALMKKMLTNEHLWVAGYGQAELLIDLGKVCNSNGLGKLAGKLANPGLGANTAKGYRYELQVAAHFAQNGGANITCISKYVKADATMSLTSTEVDLIIDGVYYQVKSSAGAFGSLNKVKTWVSKAQNDGAPVIKYVTKPDEHANIPAKIRAWLDDPEENGVGYAIEIIDVPGF